jgi:glycosyltransferase involved in cell wall biosynthesis
MNYPTVSVIMPAYNHADFVLQSIESVLAQKNVDFELLISDDGSTDSTNKNISKIIDKRIRFYPNKNNRGACVVTNELIQRATGKFIALINSDDFWVLEDKLQYQLDILNNNPNIGACFGRAKFIDKYSNKIDKTLLSFGTVFDQENRSQGKWLRRLFEGGNCICHPTILIRKSCYDDVGLYNNRLRQLPDYDMWIRLVKKYPIHVSDRELISFRIISGGNASSNTINNSIRIINEHYLIAENFFDGIDEILLKEGFFDLLKIKNIPSLQHLNIEKNLLYFIDSPWLGKVYKAIGLLRIYKLLSCPDHNKILYSDYGIDDHWFHKETENFELFRSKIVAGIGEKKSKLHYFTKKLLKF